MEDHRHAMVAWTVVCRPKSQGGLGIKNLSIQNNSLMLKNLHKFYNRQNIPWVTLIWESYYDTGALPGQQLQGSFWWKAHLKLVDLFKSMAKCNVGDGRSVSFWTDLWHSNCLHIGMPHLFSFAKDTQLTVFKVTQMEFLEDMFHLPLSVQAYDEFLQLEQICDDLRSSQFNDCTDTWSYLWGTANFSAAKAYNVMIGVRQVPPHFQWIWKSSCQTKHKVFFWMVLHDSVNTRNLLRRKTFHLDSYNCAIAGCSQEETLFHLFLGYPFVQPC